MGALDLSGRSREQTDGGDGGEKKSSSSSSGSGGKSDRTQRRHSAEVRDRLAQVFERIAEWREGRGDTELAHVIREDGRAMVGGIVSLTGSFEWVRGPLLVALGIAEPLIAFGRVMRIVGGRVATSRAERMAEREAELAAEAAAAGVDEPPEPGRFAG